MNEPDTRLDDEIDAGWDDLDPTAGSEAPPRSAGELDALETGRDLKEKPPQARTQPVAAGSSTKSAPAAAAIAPAENGATRRHLSKKERRALARRKRAEEAKRHSSTKQSKKRERVERLALERNLEGAKAARPRTLQQRSGAPKKKVSAKLAPKAAGKDKRRAQKKPSRAATQPAPAKRAQITEIRTATKRPLTRAERRTQKKRRSSAKSRQGKVLLLVALLTAAASALFVLEHLTR